MEEEVRKNIGSLIYFMNVNDMILEKNENITPDINEHMLELTDYVIFQISTYAASLVRTKLNISYKSIGSCLLCRSIIEALSLLKMYENGEISEENVELLMYYSYICEYKIYKKYKNLDEIGLFSFEQILGNYSLAKNHLKKYGSTKGIKKNLSWLKQFESFGGIVKKNLPEYYDSYKLFSALIHPNHCLVTEPFYDSIDTNIYIGLALEATERYFPCKILRFKYDVNYLSSILKMDSFKKVKEKSSNICKALYTIALHIKEIFGANLQSSFYGNIADLFDDCFSDISFGFREVSATKFKTLLELICVINYSLAQKNTSFDFIFAMHTKYKISKTLNLEFDIAFEYESVNKHFVSLDEFQCYLNLECGIEGFDSINKLVYNCVDELVSNEIYSNLIKMIYDESQYLSHGNCYMLKCNPGVFNTSNYTIDFFLDLLVKCIKNHLNIYLEYKKSGGEKNFNKLIYDMRKNIKIIEGNFRNFSSVWGDLH